MSDRILASDAEGTGLGALLRERREEILEEWEQRAGKLGTGRSLGTLRLRDHLPEFLDRTAEAIGAGRRGEVTAFPDGLPDLHALQRLEDGYDLGAVVMEYSALRAVVVGLLGSPRRLEGDDEALFHRIIDHAIARAVECYAEARDRALRSLDRLAAEALGTGDVATFLPRLLQILMETTAAVDTAVILLREGEELQVRASAGLTAEEAQTFSVRIGEGFAGRIGAERMPLMISSAWDDPLVKSRALKERQVKGLYGVALEHEGDLVGVTLVGSQTASGFSDVDQQLIRTMARRATSVIVQRQLLQRERTAKLEAEGALALLDTLLEASPMGIAFLDKELRYVRVNAALAGLNGKPVRDHLGHTVREVLSPEATQLLEPMLQRLIATGEPVRNVELELVLPGDSGGKRTLLLNYYPVRTEAGEVLGVGGLVLDITDRKRAEEELRRDAEILDLGDPFFLMDKDFRITRVNKAQQEISRMPREQTLGRVFWELWPTAADPESKYWQHYTRAMRERVPTSFEEHYAPMGLWTDTTVYPTSDGGLAVFFRDSTDRKRAEQDLRAAFEFKDRFLGIVGHDLRNPLGAIKMSAAALARYVPESPRVNRTVDRIVAAAERMSRMIDDLLDLTRGRLGGGIPVDRQRGELGEVVRELIDELRAAHPDRSLELELQGDTGGLWDADRAAQAVMNLVANAIKHGGRDSAVKVTVRGLGDEVEVDVWNGGPPIPEDVRDRLFEPFGDRIRRYQGADGLGVGLYIVKEILRAHGGRVEVRSDAEHGTVFSTSWPREPVERAQPHLDA